MRIHSPFRDYYDSVQTQEDNGVKFIRNTAEVEEIPKNFMRLLDLVPRFHRYTPEIGISSGLVGFCGQFFPCYSYFSNILQNKREYCYTLESIERMLFKHKVVPDQSRLMWRPEGYFTEKSWKVCLTNLANAKGDDLFRETESPIFHLYRKSHHTILEINPQLNELQFQKVVDPWQAFQEIEMFISSALAKQVDPIIPISDELKVQAHGMDKWSFRKEGKKSR